MKLQRKGISLEWIGYAFFLCLYFWMAQQIPYTHDDWDWGIDQGIQQLVTASVNSRYVGNLLVVIMTRSELFKVFIMGTCHFLLPYLLADLAVEKNTDKYKRRRLCCFLASCGLFFLMDSKIWQQTFGWVSGYANFVVSAVFLLVCYKEWIGVLDMSNLTCSESWPRSVLLGVVCFLSQLFIENLTVVTMIAAFLSCIIYSWKTRKISPKYVCMFLGALVGLLVMFSSPIYSELKETGMAVDGHREVAVMGNLGIWENITRIFWQCANLAWLGIDENAAINIIILLALSGLMILHKGAMKKEVMAIALVINMGLCFYYVLSYLGNMTLYDTERPLVAIALIESICFYAVVIIEVLICTGKNRKKRRDLLLAWGSAFVVILPLAVVKQSGPRMLFTYYVFAVLFVIVLLDWLMECIPFGARCIISVLSAAVLIGSTLLYIEAYAGNGQCIREREKIVAEAIENDYESIILPRYPHTRFLWGPYPNTPKHQRVFREFYGMEETIEITLDYYPKVNSYWKKIK